MKLMKKLISAAVSAAIILSLLLSFTACFKNLATPEVEPQPKEEIINNINAAEENNTRSFDYLADFLIEWGFPEFNKEKVVWAEAVFVQHYGYNGGLSSEKDAVLPRAIAVARMYLENYYDTTTLTDKAAVTDGIINTIVEFSLDPYGVYRLPVASDEHNEDMSGEFGGIGVVVEYNDVDCTVMITEVMIGSPAEKAGIEVGDFVWAVDGKLVSEIGHREAIYYVRGEIGTEVTLVMKRGEELLTFVATRELVEVRTVGYALTEENYGYIQVTSFKDNTDEQFIDAIDHLTELGASGFIIDMRNNLGGYVQTAVNMLSYILPSGKELITYDYKSTADRTLVSSTDKNSKGEQLDHVIELPIVLLCNEYSASASEIFASVLRDYDKEGLVNLTSVGTQTYKKGVIQSLATYKDGSTITLTVAYYYPPSGEMIHGVGVTPDVIVENTETEDRQLEAALEEMAKLLSAKN